MKMIKLTSYDHSKKVWYVNSHYIVSFNKTERNGTFVSLADSVPGFKAMYVRETPKEIMSMINRDNVVYGGEE